jgi:CheY-like chemotaxis protein
MAAASGWNPFPEKDPPSTSRSRSEKDASPERHKILLVEDNRSDVFLLREAIAAAGVPADLHVVSDGEWAIEFIDQMDAGEDVLCPSLVILDLNLPKRTGAEVLEYLRQSGKFRNIPVLIVTSSDSEEDRARAIQLGAAGYFRKPSAYEAFLKIGEVVKDILTARPPG